MIILCLDWKQSWPFPLTSAIAESASTCSDRHMDTDSGGSSGGCYSWNGFCSGGLELSKTYSSLFPPQLSSQEEQWVSCLPSSWSCSWSIAWRKRMRAVTTWGRNPSTRKPPQTSSMPKAQQHLVPIKGQTKTVRKHCALRWDVLNKCCFMFWIEFQSDFEKKQTSFVTLPIPLQLTRAQWNTKSLKKNLSVFFFLS